MHLSLQIYEGGQAIKDAIRQCVQVIASEVQSSEASHCIKGTTSNLGKVVVGKVKRLQMAVELEHLGRNGRDAVIAQVEALKVRDSSEDRQGKVR